MGTEDFDAGGFKLLVFGVVDAEAAVEVFLAGNVRIREHLVVSELQVGHPLQCEDCLTMMRVIRFGHQIPALFPSLEEVRDNGEVLLGLVVIGPVVTLYAALLVDGLQDCLDVLYPGIMHASGNFGPNRAMEIGEISRQLKETAKEMHIPIIALAQLNRNLMSRQNSSNGRPVLSDLKDSGSIEQDADMVLFIHRPSLLGLSETGDDFAELVITKNRSGEMGVIGLHFNGDLVKFTESNESLAAYAARMYPSAMNNMADITPEPSEGYSPFPADR